MYITINITCTQIYKLISSNTHFYVHKLFIMCVFITEHDKANAYIIMC